MDPFFYVVALVGFGVIGFMVGLGFTLRNLETVDEAQLRTELARRIYLKKLREEAWEEAQKAGK